MYKKINPTKCLITSSWDFCILFSNFVSFLVFDDNDKCNDEQSKSDKLFAEYESSNVDD